MKEFPMSTMTGIAPRGRIATLGSLQEHLQWAIELEHFTIPPYLCALYSLDPVRNPEAAEAIASVMVEEMLHLTLAANLLNAVGGRPQIDTPRMLLPYPRPLPHSDGSFEVPLARFSPESLEVFLQIERPAPPGAPPEGDQYESIGQFYDAIRRGLSELREHLGEAQVFCGDPARQVTDADVYTGGGRIVTVTSLDSALAALEEIVDQGEGCQLEIWDGDVDVLHPERDQIAHYFRFKELKLGRRFQCGDTPQSGPTGERIAVDWDGVFPMRSNPRTSDHAPGSPIRTAQEAFNRTYCTLLQQLDQAFKGSPEVLGPAVGAMYGLADQARELMQMPTEDGLATAGPTFEYVVSA
jgi:Ferritin-like